MTFVSVCVCINTHECMLHRGPWYGESQKQRAKAQEMYDIRLLKHSVHIFHQEKSVTSFWFQTLTAL